MLRLRAVVTIALFIAVIYALAPPERKKRWLDRLRELAKALAVSMVLYWAYMLAVYFLRRS